MKTYVAVETKKQGQALVRKLRNRNFLATYASEKVNGETLRGVEVFIPAGWTMDRTWTFAANLVLQP